jgi:membrane-bound lytic murein transglycosylase MltF
MELNQRQLEIKEKIIKIAEAIGLNSSWALAIAMTESSLGEKQKSPTGCRGVFQMSSIAMKDLLIEMEKADDDIIDIACGLAFLHLLLKRHKSFDNATAHFCDPNDKWFYIERMRDFMREFDEKR